jgi:uncharacterized protein (DUF362 family)
VAAAGVLGDGMASAAQAGSRSRVIVVRDRSSISQSDSPGGRVDRRVVAEMLDRAIVRLTGVSDSTAAWKSLFRPDDVVGIKVNCLFGVGACTHPEVAHAVADALVRAGVKPSNVIIWDRATGDLLKSGYKINRDGPGVRVLANDGVWEDRPTRQGQFEGRLTRIITEQITALINVPVIKDHGIAGITAALKNHYGSFDNPGRHHGNHCDPYLADLNAIPAIRDKTRLVVLDALRPMADGGPGLRRDSLWDFYSLVVSRDPVAVDYFAWKTIDERRAQTGLKSLAESGREPKWIATAARYGLGTDDPARMDIVRIG